jgi:large subunit ribosomal protein L19
MSNSALIDELEADQLKKNIPDFRVGDTIRVSLRIVESGTKEGKDSKEGEKDRIQVFTGTVIARKGRGLSETFSMHRISYGEGMERVFMLHSPRITKIEIAKRGRVRRSKLYYLRGTSGKKAKVQEHLGIRGSKENAKGASSPKESSQHETQQPQS